MERDRRVLALLGSSLVVIFAFSYAVGYYVGKQAGVREEKERCEIEKKQLMKTLAQITPVSRPQPQIEERVVGAPQVEEAESITPETQVATAEVKGAEEKESPKEEKPKEEKKEVEKAAKEPYYLQVGVFKSRANAEKLVKALKAKGFNPQIVSTDGLVKVIVGYYPSLEAAASARRELKKAGYNSIIKRRKD